MFARSSKASSRGVGRRGDTTKDEVIAELGASLLRTTASLGASQTPAVINARNGIADLVQNCDGNPHYIKTKIGEMSVDQLKSFNSALGTSNKDHKVSMLKNAVFSGHLAAMRVIEGELKVVKDGIAESITYGLTTAFGDATGNIAWSSSDETAVTIQSEVVEALGRFAHSAGVASAEAKAKAKAKAAAMPTADVEMEG